MRSKCGLNDSVCNSKQKWSNGKCRCDCKELDDSSSCKDNYIRNPSTCDYECNNGCKIDKNLDLENCSCKNMFNW